MKQCKLIVRDAVNVRLEGLDLETRKLLSAELRFVVPNAKHTPQYKLGRWDGTVSFFANTGNTYLSLLDRLLPIVVEAGYDIDVEDHRPAFDFRLRQPDENMFAHIRWPKGHPRAGDPILLRDYQVEAIRTFIANPQGVQTISTGAGKTLLTAALSYTVEPYGRSIIIVPNKSLVLQTEEDYRNIGLDVGVFYGDRKEWNHKHTICTWQSLAVFNKKTQRNEAPVPIEDFIAGVVCIIVDETHTAKAQELRNLLCGPCANIPFRWGLTGTIPKEEHEAVSLLASLGPVVGELRAAELQDRGVLAQCNIEIVQLDDSHVAFPDYESEYRFLTTDSDRIDWLAKFVTGLAESGNTLVLVDRRETGWALEALIPNSIFVYGDMKIKARKTEYEAIQTSNNRIIIATYGVAAVGINVPRLFNLVLFECGKSFVRTIQSIGRILRVAKDKTSANVYDVCSSLKFSRRHISKRKEYYEEARYKFSHKKVPYGKD